MDLKRDNLIDIVKAVGIISIVIGHASWEIKIGNITAHIGNFVYLYHLAIFAFCSGYLYNDDTKDIWMLISKKLKHLYLPFLFYNLTYLLIRPILINLKLVDGANFSFFNGDYIIQISNIITFNSLGELLSALWFVPMIFFSIIIFAAIRISIKPAPNKFIKEMLACILFFIVGGIGLYSTENKFGLLFNLQISYLFVPIVALGFYFKKLNGWKIITRIGLFISFYILYKVVQLDLGLIELSKYMIISKTLFYPISICGIYFVLSLSKFLSSVKYVKNPLQFIGQNSFDIMALHFFSFKCVDFIFCYMTDNLDLLPVFPHSFDDLWPIYYICGILLPLFIKRFLLLGKSKILNH